MSNNNAQNWNGDFTFAGTNNLNMGTGVATLGGSGSSRQITVNGGVVSIGSINGTAGSGYGFTKAGAGTLTVGSAASTLNGDLNVTGGTLQIGASDVQRDRAHRHRHDRKRQRAPPPALVLNTAADKTFSGTLQNGAGAGLLGLIKRGTGDADPGRHRITSAAISRSRTAPSGSPAPPTSARAATAWSTSATSPTRMASWRSTAARSNAVKNTAPSIAIGSVANSRGFVKMTSGAITTDDEFHVGARPGGILFAHFR